MNSATTHLSLHACSRRLGTNASRFRRLQFIYCQLVLGTRRVPYLAGKKLTLAWVAASAADEAAITAQVEARLRRQLAELTEVAAQAKRLGVAVDPAQARDVARWRKADVDPGQASKLVVAPDSRSAR